MIVEEQKRDGRGVVVEHIRRDGWLFRAFMVWFGRGPLRQ